MLEMEDNVQSVLQGGDEGESHVPRMQMPHFFLFNRVYGKGSCCSQGRDHHQVCVTPLFSCLHRVLLCSVAVQILEVTGLD